MFDPKPTLGIFGMGMSQESTQSGMRGMKTILAAHSSMTKKHASYTFLPDDTSLPQVATLLGLSANCWEDGKG